MGTLIKDFKSVVETEAGKNLLQILDKIDELELLEAAADKVEDEEESDRLYAEKYHEAEKAARIIEKMSGIDQKTAMRMIWYKKEEIKKLFEKLA